jgi:hypothetical protein
MERKKLEYKNFHRCNPEDIKAFATKYKEIIQEGLNLRR